MLNPFIVFCSLHIPMHPKNQQQYLTIDHQLIPGVQT